MWLVVRWILLPWVVGRRIHPSTAVGCPPGGWGPAPASENPSTDRCIRQLKDGFDGQLPMGEESIE